MASGKIRVSASRLDHASIIVPDLAVASVAWRALGFRLAPRARHLAPGADGVAHPTGTGNHVVMLNGAYLELLAVIDPTRPSATIAGMLARHVGVHIISLAVENAEVEQARLQRAGFTTGLTRTERRTPGGVAMFERLPLSDALPRMQLIHHMTPELVFPTTLPRHPNPADSLTAVVLVSDAPAVLAARLSRAAGQILRPDPLGGYSLDLSPGRLRVLPPDAAMLLFGQPMPGPLPRVAGVMLRTSDANRAVARRTDLRTSQYGLVGMASGTAVLFHA